MQIELKYEPVIDYIEQQARLQGVTPSRLVEKLCYRCWDLRLIESLATTQSSAEWANEQL